MSPTVAKAVRLPERVMVVNIGLDRFEQAVRDQGASAMSDAAAVTADMARICAGTSTRLRLPVLDNLGTPLGVDVRKVVETSITPTVNTGIVHATDGSGRVGAGVAHAPLECFVQALHHLAHRLT